MKEYLDKLLTIFIVHIFEIININRALSARSNTQSINGYISDNNKGDLLIMKILILFYKLHLHISV